VRVAEIPFAGQAGIVAGLLVSVGRRSMFAMRYCAAILLGLLCFTAISCDTKPPPPPATPSTEVARLPLVELKSQGAPTVISIAPNASRIALRVRSGDAMNPQDTLKLYDATNKQWEEPSLPVPEGEKLVAVHFSPDGRFQLGIFVSSHPYRDLRVFRTQDVGEMFAAQTDMHGLAAVTFSPDGKWMLHPTPPDKNGRFAFAVVNVTSGAPRATLNVDMRMLSRGAFRNVAFTPDSNFVFGHQVDHLLVWNASSGQLVTEWQWVGIGDVATMGCTPDSQIVRALMQEGTIATIELPAGNNVRTGRLGVPPVPANQPRHVPFEQPWAFRRAAFSSDGTSVLLDAGGQIDVFDLQTGRFARIFTLPAGTTQVDFAPRQGDLVPVQVRGAEGDSIAILRLPR
jgi:WD40 repeat protein